ncbi:ABC transporter permease [Clostridium sp. C105KSO13]|uniref:ABC transporter permease n=1 Tax=Clostridium sp. C105KSO13 TaxID=1776045 RepID=UPI00074083FC|nr:ABC transporter permease [Clostridium sp. C105KSO13]CUX29957.1 Ribose transport system permease protein RbsC [Clostridium sp. C105KSO13]
MKKYLKQFSTIIILVVMVIFFTMCSGNFFKVNNILNILRQVSVLSILTAGMTFVVISGGMDLTVGSYLGLTGVVAVQLMTVLHMNIGVSCLLTIIVITVFGLITGLLIVTLNVSPIVITLGMQTVVRGIAYIISGGLPIYDVPDSIVFLGQGYVFGIPVPVIIMVVIVLIMGIVLKYTYFGRYVYAIGGNVEAAKLAGVAVNKILISLYAISAFLTALAGIALTGRLSSGAPASGTGTEMDVITAVVIGGVSINGGKGSMLGAFVGAVIIGVLSNGLTIMNVSEYYQQVVKGLVLILAVAFDVLANRERIKKVKAA